MSLPHVAYSGIAYFGQNLCPCGIWLIVVTAYFGQNLCPCGIWRIVVTAYFGQNVCPCGIWFIVILLTFTKLLVLVAFGSQRY